MRISKWEHQYIVTLQILRKTICSFVESEKVLYIDRSTLTTHYRFKLEKLMAVEKALTASQECLEIGVRGKVRPYKLSTDTIGFMQTVMSELGRLGLGSATEGVNPTSAEGFYLNFRTILTELLRHDPKGIFEKKVH